MTTVVINTKTLHDSFSGNGEYHEVVAPGFAYSQDEEPALTSADFTDLELHNYSLINNSVGLAVYFTAKSTGTLINEASGYIQGGEGVRILSTGVTLENYGTIHGTDDGRPGAIYLQSPARGDFIDNYGKIWGADTAIDNNTSGGRNYIYNNNAGTIEGVDVGIGLDSSPGRILFVTNDGTIKGGCIVL